MKTNFLVKLFLLSLTAVSLNSCTVDEDTSQPTNQDSNMQIAKDVDGDPILPAPKK